MIILSVVITFVLFNNECVGQRQCSKFNICKIKEVDLLLRHLLPANKARGEPCMVNDQRGTCEPWRHCYTMLVDNIERNFPPVCSFDGVDPIVCCTSCSLVDDVTKANVISAKGNIVWMSKQKSWNQCISYAKTLQYGCKYSENWSATKVWNDTKQCFQVEKKFLGGRDSVGGRDANRDEFPEMALLGYGPTEDTAQWLCGGTVISDRFILTAAHCMSSSTLGAVTFAAMGILKRTDPEELWQKYRIEQRIPHELYHSPSKYHDIALLKTEMAITFSHAVVPACLADISLPPPDLDKFAFAAGWGAKGNRAALADTLQAVFGSRSTCMSTSALPVPSSTKSTAIS